MFVKTPQRLEALSYVILIVLMILTLLEGNVRKALKTEEEHAVVSGNRKTFTLMGISIIEALEQIQILFYYCEKVQTDEKGKKLGISAKI